MHPMTYEQSDITVQPTDDSTRKVVNGTSLL